MTTRIPVQIPVFPWFSDHSFNGKVIFPAVETMLLLAAAAREIDPAILPETLLQAKFSKFLEIPKEAGELSALVEYEEIDGNLSLRLLSKIQFKKISRIKEHAELLFSTSSQYVIPLEQAKRKETDIAIDADRIYRELVPFGPTYRSIVGTLYLAGASAIATLQAPQLAGKQEMEDVLGSPFPLDGAMHAACVLGQCMADFIPFPVGFGVRSVHKPTQAGAIYNTTVKLVAQTANELVFDLSLFDDQGDACETVIGLQMRDVSGGMIKPPADLPRLITSP